MEVPELVDGQLAGMWRRLKKPRVIAVELRLGRTLDEAEWHAVHAELTGYQAFSGVDVVLV